MRFTAEIPGFPGPNNRLEVIHRRNEWDSFRNPDRKKMVLYNNKKLLLLHACGYARALHPRNSIADADSWWPLTAVHITKASIGCTLVCVCVEKKTSPETKTGRRFSSSCVFWMRNRGRYWDNALCRVLFSLLFFSSSCALTFILLFFFERRKLSRIPNHIANISDR